MCLICALLIHYQKDHQLSLPSLSFLHPTVDFHESELSINIYHEIYYLFNSEYSDAKYYSEFMDHV